MGWPTMVPRAVAVWDISVNEATWAAATRSRCGAVWAVTSPAAAATQAMIISFFIMCLSFLLGLLGLVGNLSFIWRTPRI